MGIGQLLFNPNGRIGPRTFWRGVILLLAIMIVLQVLSVYGGTILGGILGLLSLAMPYLYLCVYGKRLHDAGRSAWWYLLFLAAYIIGNSILQSVLLPVFSPQAAELQQEMAALMEEGRFTEIFAYGPEIARLSLFTTLLTLIVMNAALGWLAARLKSEPGPNRFGPPPGGMADTFN